MQQLAIDVPNITHILGTSDLPSADTEWTPNGRALKEHLQTSAAT